MHFIIAQLGVTPASPWEWVLTGGAVGSLALFLYGFHTRWWVNGSVYEERVEEVKQRDKTIAERDEMIHQLRSERDRAVAEARQAADAVRDAKDEEIATIRNRVEKDIIPLITRSTDLLAAFVNQRGQ